MVLKIVLCFVHPFFFSLFMRVMATLSCPYLSLFLSASRFIEYGRYGGHYYGTSLYSVHRVMAEGKVCLLDVHPTVSIMPPKKIVSLMFTWPADVGCVSKEKEVFEPK